jgi:iron complex transport system substrate-binding protein
MTIRTGFALLCRRAAPLVVALCGFGGCRDGEGDATAPRRAAVPQRIVCGSPAVTEIVYALGCGDRVVGVSAYTVYPAEALGVARIGGWIDPNRERLLVLKPDIILSQGLHATLAEFAAEFGMRFHHVKLDSLADLYAAVSALADVLAVPDRGRTLNAELRGALDATGARAARARPVRVLALLGRAPGALNGLSTIGPGTFLDDLLRVAGGSNVFSDALGPYPQISKESLLARNPEVILELYPGGVEPSVRSRLRADWQTFSTLPAVRDGRIHYLTNDFLLIPGPRADRIAALFAAAIRPETADE